MNNRMPKILTSPTKNAREVVNPYIYVCILDSRFVGLYKKQ